MARQEHDREDLLAEAKALVERVELQLPGTSEPWVIGVRRDGCLSLYCSPGEAYHFNTRGELRRAYRDERLLKAELGRIIALTRVRTASEVQLVRHAFADAEQASLLSELRQRLAALQAALQAKEAVVVRQVPADVPLLERVQDWLAAVPYPLSIASEPHAR